MKNKNIKKNSIIFRFSYCAKFAYILLLNWFVYFFHDGFNYVRNDYLLSV